MKGQLRQVLRWLFHDGLVCLTFPSDGEIGSEDYLLTGYCDASHAPMRSTKRKGISGAAKQPCRCQHVNVNCSEFRQLSKNFWVYANWFYVL